MAELIGPEPVVRDGERKPAPLQRDEECAVPGCLNIRARGKSLCVQDTVTEALAVLFDCAEQGFRATTVDFRTCRRLIDERGEIEQSEFILWP